MAELRTYGPDGVLRGVDAVRRSGSSYMPNLNKFVSYCAEAKGGYSAANGHGTWETCPFTGRRRRLKPGYELLAERLGSKDDPRMHEEIRRDIEEGIANGSIECLHMIGGRST